MNIIERFYPNDPDDTDQQMLDLLSISNMIAEVISPINFTDGHSRNIGDHIWDEHLASYERIMGKKAPRRDLWWMRIISGEGWAVVGLTDKTTGSTWNFNNRLEIAIADDTLAVQIRMML